MEIKKSKKLLNTLIATSFAGIAVTPIVLTSCAKNDNSFKGFILSTVMNKAKVEGKFEDNKTDINTKLSGFDANGVATLALVPDKTEANCKKFTIKLELPFEDDTTDASKKLFDIEVKSETKGLKEGLTGDAADFIKVGKKKVDLNNKKNVSWEVTITPNKGNVKENGGQPAKFDPNVTFSEITFTFKNTKKDAKNDDQECKFVYKITYAEKQ